MSQVNRNQPRRGTASESRYSLFEFEAQFPDDAACLVYLMAEKYPDGVFCEKCEKVTGHHREKARPSWSCQFCGHRVHPMVGTIFEDSATSLRLWFYAIYLMASTRCGISAKQLERELGVTYKTAWRMFHQIRLLLVQDDAPIGGEGEIVEADEAFIGGLSKWRNHGKPKGKGGGWVGKQPVHGFVQRGRDGKTGKIRARVLPESASQNFAQQLVESTHVRVLPKSALFTDTYVAYDHMGERGYKHKRVNHTRRIYVDGIVHTNTIEGSLLRRRDQRRVPRGLHETLGRPTWTSTCSATTTGTLTGAGCSRLSFRAPLCRSRGRSAGLFEAIKELGPLRYWNLHAGASLL